MVNVHSSLDATAQVNTMLTSPTVRMKEGVVKTAAQLESCLVTGRVTSVLRKKMTKAQAETLAAECDAIVFPRNVGRRKSERTTVTVMQWRPTVWIVRFETGTQRTTITELIPANNAVEMHKRSL